MPEPAETLEVEGHAIKVTNPSKVFFPDAEGGPITKLDLVRYWIEVAEVALTGCRDRPAILHRFPNGVADDGFYQKRSPKGAPEWVQTALITFPSGRTATMPVMADAAHIAWSATLGCLEVNPWPVRRTDVDRPDELRIDLDPGPDVPFDWVRDVALAAREVLGAHGLSGYPKTSGKRGIHINVRIEPRWTFTEMRRAALALAREVERLVPDMATTAWWKEERHGVFLDYNQNARDRTVASAYSVRPMADARVSTPITWDEVATVDPAAFTMRSIPERLRRVGDPGAGIDDTAGSLVPLLERAAEHDASGLADAPWPPHFEKGADEPPRVAPSRRRRPIHPLIEIARAATKTEALEGLERWKLRHPEVAAHLEPSDVLVDSMRGRSSTWTRIRLNLRHVPAAERPEQGPLEVDYDPWAGVSWSEDEPQDGGSSPS
ncbi:MAG: DNA polymerase domain-containing protein [Actinomycetota bacterium]